MTADGEQSLCLYLDPEVFHLFFSPHPVTEGDVREQLGGSLAASQGQSTTELMMYQ